MALNVYLPAKFSRLYLAQDKSSASRNAFFIALGLEYNKRIFWLSLTDVCCLSDKAEELNSINIMLKNKIEWRNMVRVDGEQWVAADNVTRKITLVSKSEAELFANSSVYKKRAMRKKDGSFWWSFYEVRHYLNNEQGVLF